MKQVFLVLFCVAYIAARSQTSDTEFRKGSEGVVFANSGFVTNFSNYPPDLFSGGLSFNPQFCAVPNRLRVGADLGVAYVNKKVSGLFGAMVAYKLKTFNIGSLAGLANLYVSAMAEWGTQRQRLAGMALMAEVLQKLHLGLSVRRDYRLNDWWFQSRIGMVIFNTTVAKSTFDHQ